MEKKKCRSCREEKALNEFYSAGQRRGGLQPDCKKCMLAYQVTIRQRNKEDFEKGIRLTKQKCGKCHLIKSADEFHISPTTKGGLHNRCKSCVIQHQEETNILRIWQRTKNRAIKKKMSFDITLDDIKIPKICPVLHIPISTILGRGRAPDGPSIDRIDNLKGYIRGNIRIISERANSLKRDGSPQEIILLAEDAQRILAKNIMEDL